MPSNSFEIVSTLGVEYKPHIEKLLFFNDSQNEFSNKIVSSLEKYGQPEIVQIKNTLKIVLKSRIETHSLFFLSNEDDKKLLLGTAVITKGENDDAILLHIAMENSLTPDFLLLSFITKIRTYLSSFKQIKWLRIFYIERNVKLKV